MPKKVKATVEGSTAGSSKSHSPPTLPKLKVTSQPSTSSLIISRNKHWRYISCFNGPWLQLPPEILESLANSNYTLPRPRPIDPAVFYDLVKIRRLVEEATSLSVRAASGVTASGLSNDSDGSLFGNGTSRGQGPGGGNAKLSRERKHRMREQAVQKLAKAYCFDEISCSVATMQASSLLEDVAQHVLQRNASHVDASYVNFFHEKIPSRQLAEYTSLTQLDNIIAERHMEAEPLRTRATVKMFMEDYQGAIQDLTTALQVCRTIQGMHKAGRQQLQLASEVAAEVKRNGHRRGEVRVDEEDQPSSLEAQLLFHRAGAYLSLACQNIKASLPERIIIKSSNGTPRSNGNHNGIDEHTTADVLSNADNPEEEGSCKLQLEARKVVKVSAKRALRDYTAFLVNLDYTPGLDAELTDAFLRQANLAASRYQVSKARNGRQDTGHGGNMNNRNGHTSEALVPRPLQSSHRQERVNGSTSLPVHQVSDLFSCTPLSSLSQNLHGSTALMTSIDIAKGQQATGASGRSNFREAVTYHPLMTDALHSLLLCHCLMQTSPKELQRHADMVARLTRITDGFPVFQTSRSPSRSDWVEILCRCTGSPSFIRLSQSWDALCAPLASPGAQNHGANERKETEAERKERLKQQAIIEALEDDRVHDEDSFQKAVEARQRRQQEEANPANGNGAAGNSAASIRHDDSIGSDRAQNISRWILEAPATVAGSGGKKKKKRPIVRNGLNGVTNGLKDLKVASSIEFETVEEEVD